MPTSCCVVGCPTRSKDLGVQTFPFPKPGKLREHWLMSINRKWIPKISDGWRICARHFSQEAHVPPHLNVDSKNRPRKKPRLKDFAYPTLFLKPEKKDSLKDQAKSDSETKDSNDSQPSATVTSSCNASKPQNYKNLLQDHKYPLSRKRPRSLPEKLQIPIEESCSECEKSSEIIAQKDQQIEQLQKELADSNAKVDKLTQELSKLNESLSNTFNQDQIRKIMDPKKRLHWSDDTIQKAIQCYYKMSSTGYDFLRQLDYPTPHRRTLQRKLAEIEVGPGILEDHIKMLGLKSEHFPESGKVVGLIIDGMSLNAKLEFDIVTQSFVGRPTIPATDKIINDFLEKGLTEADILAYHALNCLCVGITLPYKQLVGYHFVANGFNVQAVAQWLRDIIERLTRLGFKVVFLATDMCTQMTSV